MSCDKLDQSLIKELEQLNLEGRAKPDERVITGYIPARSGRGPRYKLKDSEKEFIRMNSNSYLSLSNHREVIKAADDATAEFGVGPGAVRFIDGTFSHHRNLENEISIFLNKPAAKIFNSAYTANCGLALAISNPGTHWIGDQLNHNSIIRAMRIANIPKNQKSIYRHNDMSDLEQCLEKVPTGTERVIVIFDGIFSMRGDNAPIDQIITICRKYDSKFKDGVITVVDDSHGIGAYGKTGRGTPEYCNAWPDIVVGTFGKAFGVNGGFIAASRTITEAVRQKADTYIYTNPLSVADCAAAVKAIKICNSPEGKALLNHLQQMTQSFRQSLENLKKETIGGPHPIVPLLVRNTPETHALVTNLFEHGVLAAGLTFPVVPKGDETIRFQVNACHTETDIDHVIKILKAD